MLARCLHGLAQLAGETDKARHQCRELVARDLNEHAGGVDNGSGLAFDDPRKGFINLTRVRRDWPFSEGICLPKKQTGSWTRRGSGGLIGFYHEIAGVGLVFPLAARPIAVSTPGTPSSRCGRSRGIEFVEEAVAAVGSSGEFAHHSCGGPVLLAAVGHRLGRAGVRRRADSFEK
jgi:hypothetical protein